MQPHDGRGAPNPFAACAAPPACPLLPAAHSAHCSRTRTHLRSTFSLPPLSRYVSGSGANDARRRSAAMSARGSLLAAVMTAVLGACSARVRSSTTLCGSIMAESMLRMSD